VREDSNNAKGESGRLRVLEAVQKFCGLTNRDRRPRLVPENADWRNGREAREVGEVEKMFL
jgi:hypothetical protein